MRYRMMVVLCVLCMALLLFTACGVAFDVPNVQDRPEATGNAGLDYEPPAPQTAVTAESDLSAKQPPAYWKGQFHTLPGTVAPTQSSEASAEPSVSGSTSTDADEPQGSSASTESEPSQGSQATTEPPHTTATTPDPQGEGRGDAFEVTEKSGNGTKEIQCTPFY